MSRSRSTALVKLSCLIVSQTVLFPIMALAQEGGMAADIARCESSLRGQSQSDGSAEQRVRSLEKGIFGKSSSGPLDKRLHKIHKALGLSDNVGASTAVASPSAQTPVAATPFPDGEPKAPPQPMASDLPEQTVASPKTKTPAYSTPPISSGPTTKQLLQLGAQKFAQGDTVQSERLFNAALGKDPNNVDALFNLGAIAERRGDLNSALNDYKKALALNTTDAELKQAVASVENQLAKKPASSSSKPLFGSALIDDKLNDPLSAQTAGFGAPILPQVDPQPPVVGVTPPNFNQVPTQPINVPQVPVTPHGKGFIKGALGVGLMAAPGPLHCPICRLINGL